MVSVGSSLTSCGLKTETNCEQQTTTPPPPVFKGWEKDPICGTHIEALIHSARKLPHRH